MLARTSNLTLVSLAAGRSVFVDPRFQTLESAPQNGVSQFQFLFVTLVKGHRTPKTTVARDSHL